MKQEVRNAMPLLGAALDRMCKPAVERINLNDEPYKAFEEWKDRHPL